MVGYIAIVTLSSDLMTLDSTFSMIALVCSLVSICLAIMTYLKEEKTRKLAVLSFRKNLMEPYLKWREELGTIELDPPPGESFRYYPKEERRRIRDYWPKVILIELELLKSVDKNLIKVKTYPF